MSAAHNLQSQTECQACNVMVLKEEDLEIPYRTHISPPPQALILFLANECNDTHNHGQQSIERQGVE